MTNANWGLAENHILWKVETNTTKLWVVVKVDKRGRPIAVLGPYTGKQALAASKAGGLDHFAHPLTRS